MKFPMPFWGISPPESPPSSHCRVFLISLMLSVSTLYFFISFVTCANLSFSCILLTFHVPMHVSVLAIRIRDIWLRAVFQLVHCFSTAIHISLALSMHSIAHGIFPSTTIGYLLFYKCDAGLTTTWLTGLLAQSVRCTTSKQATRVRLPVS